MKKPEVSKKPEAPTSTQPEEPRPGYLAVDRQLFEQVVFYLGGIAESSRGGLALGLIERLTNCKPIQLTEGPPES